MTATGIFVHDPDRCAGQPCPFHNPSDHPLSAAALHVRFDRPIRFTFDGTIYREFLTERTCAHGVGHPDPDSLAYLRNVLADDYPRYALGTHGCDGCCIGRGPDDGVTT